MGIKKKSKADKLAEALARIDVMEKENSRLRQSIEDGGRKLILSNMFQVELTLKTHTDMGEQDVVTWIEEVIDAEIKRTEAEPIHDMLNVRVSVGD